MRFILLAFFLGLFSSHAQDYIQFDLTMPFRGNPEQNSENPSSSDSWLLPDGLGAKIGYGYQPLEWIGFGVHSGVEWRAYHKLVTAPAYANLRVAPRVGEETRVVAQAGYGHAFAIGRGDLSGSYKRLSLGIQDGDGRAVFIEISEYGFPLYGMARMANVSVGISLISF